jgi:serine/threonine protein kinase
MKVEVESEVPQKKKGTSIDDFVLLEEIGSGSFGMVRLVQKEGKKYALKELS